MKKYRLFLLVFLIFIGYSSCLNKSARNKKTLNKGIELNSIDSICNTINKNISSFDKEVHCDIGLYRDIDSNRYSIEGKELYRLGKINLAKYFKDNVLKKIKVKFLADKHILTSEYYLDKNELIYVKKNHLIYKSYEDYKNHENVNSKNEEYYISNDTIFKSLDYYHLYNIKSKINILKHDVKTYRSVSIDDRGPMSYNNNCFK